MKARTTYARTTVNQRLLAGVKLGVERKGDVSDLRCDCKNVGRDDIRRPLRHKHHYSLSGGGETGRRVRSRVRLQNEGRDDVQDKQSNKRTGCGEVRRRIRSRVRLQKRVETTYVGQSAGSSSSQSVLEVERQGDVSDHAQGGRRRRTARLEAVAKGAEAAAAAEETRDKAEHWEAEHWAAAPTATTNWRNNNKTAFISGAMI
jgi:hypothetical protein